MNKPTISDSTTEAATIRIRTVYYPDTQTIAVYKVYYSGSRPILRLCLDERGEWVAADKYRAIVYHEAVIK